MGILFQIVIQMATMMIDHQFFRAPSPSNRPSFYYTMVVKIGRWPSLPVSQNMLDIETSMANMYMYLNMYIYTRLMQVRGSASRITGFSAGAGAAGAATSSSSSSHQQPPHTEALTQRSLYTDGFLHAEVFTQREVFTQEFLRTEAFTQRCLYTKELLHTNAFTQRSFYTQKFLHRELLHTDAFAHRSFNMQARYGAFTHRSFYTEKS